ncbi:MAG: PHP domain-containing protein [Candidatus Micrarchaeota archaeon]
MKLDLHMHTWYSLDSFNGLEEIIKKTRELGIIPAITDHNNINAHAHFKKIDKEFNFIPGEEITTNEGEIIGLYLNEAIKKGTRFLETIDLIKEQGGLTYLPHMYDNRGYGVSNLELAKKVDIIEVYNPRCLCSAHNQKAMQFAAENKKYCGAGSDSHFIFEIGNAYVELYNENILDSDISEPKGLLKALKSGKIISRKLILNSRGISRIARFVRKFFLY